jgi:hypothetical protein
MNGKAQSEQMFSGLASRPDIQLRDCHFGSGPPAEVSGRSIYHSPTLRR